MTAGAYADDYDQAIQWAADSWRTYSEEWNDRVRRDFEADYWAPTMRAADYFREQLHALAEELARARSEAP